MCEVGVGFCTVEVVTQKSVFHCLDRGFTFLGFLIPYTSLEIASVGGLQMRSWASGCDG